VDVVNAQHSLDKGFKRRKEFTQGHSNSTWKVIYYLNWHFTFKQ